MSFQYKNSCFSDYISALNAVTSDCPKVSTDGTVISCISNGEGYVITKDNGLTVTSQTVFPVFNECYVDVVQISELTAALTLLLITSFGIQMLKRSIR